jgi:aspartate aminotransferase
VFASWQNCQGWKTADGQILHHDMDFCQFILNKANVVVIPGSSFTMPGYIRISYASSTEDLEKAMTRIADAMASLQPA